MIAEYTLDYKPFMMVKGEHCWLSSDMIQLSSMPIYESLYCSVIHFVLSTINVKGANYDFWMNISSQPFNMHQQVMMPSL